VLIRPLVLCTLLVALLVGAADAKEYSADRFDSRIEVLRGGMLRITETVRLRFVDGTFTQFTREIPRRMTDGIEIVSTSMDEGVLAPGVGPGLQIRDDPEESGVRVTWRFEPISHGSHLFTLIYIVRGVVRQDAGGDLVAWRALPTRHAYAIDASTIEIQLPAVPLSAPEIRAHNGTFTVDVEGSRVLITASAVRANGWVEAYVRAPLGSIISEPSAWQRRQIRIRGGSPLWIVVSIVVLFAGLSLLFGVRQGYDAPPRDVRAPSASDTLPEPLAPPIAGALVLNGGSRLEHAMAALFVLADRGEVTIEEKPRSFGQHNFVISRSTPRRSLAPHEQRVLDIVFGVGQAAEPSVGLKQARGRLGRRLKEFSAAVSEEMTRMGLMDEGRAGVRRKFLKLGIGSMLSAALAAAGAGIFFVNRFGPWPMLVPLALLITGITGLICHVGHTALSNGGVRRAESWRAFRTHLKEVARDRAARPAQDKLRQWLPYAVAGGLGPSWGAYMNRHRAIAPRWFRALESQNSGSSFASLIAIGGADNNGHHGVSGAGAGAAAGGGSSGAH
jgi:hypothetical protein